MSKQDQEILCSLCGAAGPFTASSDSSARETQCPGCGAAHRTRNVARTLLQAAGANAGKPLRASLDALRRLDILQLAAQGPLHDILRDLPGYRCCEFLPWVRAGCRDASGVLCQDITVLTFASAAFDFVINQDILEHVEDPRLAFAEVSRVLKPGGRHIFTAPIHESLGVSRRRAQKDPDGAVRLLHPPVYHYDPIQPSGCLVYWDFGQDVIQQLALHGITACEGVSTRFYAPSETSDLNDPTQYQKYEFFKKRKALARAFHYNSITYIAEARSQARSAYRVLYSAETDALQVIPVSSLRSIAQAPAQLTAVRSESVNWGGATVQMADLTLLCPGNIPATLMLVKIFWGDFPTFVFPERCKAFPQFSEAIAAQLHAFCRKTAAAPEGIPARFHTDIHGKALESLPVSERNMPGGNAYYTSIAHLRRYAFVAADKSTPLAKVLDIGCGLGYGLSMLDPKEGLGLDISTEAIQYASRAFPQKNLSWLNRALDSAEPGGKFDTITCFELLEHLPDHPPLLDALTKWTQDNGAVFVSIPNPAKHGKDRNHFHLRDYSLDALQALFAKYFQTVEWFHQDDDCPDLRRRFLVKPDASPEHEFWVAKCAGARAGAPQAEVSIIMPLYNKWEYTQKAIAALAANTPKALDWELVLVDNASIDETAAGLRDLPIKAVIHQNTENLGFAKACNQGALLGRGNFLVFLNNDTEARPGWLEALLDELRQHPQTGIASGKLLYPDGTVQHAGVAIGPDQIPYHIHRGKAAADPLVNERRAFPVVTAACAAVRRQEFLDLGSFDEGFVNGHEDIDLCLRYRRRGQQCVYRPDCTILHHESVSDGRMKSRPQNLARTFRKSRYDLLQDDFTYRLRAESIALHPRKLKFALKIGVPQRGLTGWGDIAYAECLAKALVRAGHDCLIHYLSEWGNEDADIDVVIHIKGLSEYRPKPWNYNIMWMLNHPDLHTRQELERYDAVFVASEPHAEALSKELNVPVAPLLQATDPDIFKPSAAQEPAWDLLFVGNNDGAGRLKMRKMMELLLPTRHSLAVYGRNWEGLLPPGALKGTSLPWEELPEVYARARIVINDHQPMMAAHGFLNNRTFDALACGAIVVSDPVQGCSALPDLPQCATRDSLHKTIDAILAEPAQWRAKAAGLREAVLAGHTFAHRVEFIDAFLLRALENSAVQGRIAAARQRLANVSYRRQGPLVSVLTATFNRRNFLKTALQSVLSQTYTNWELWLVNDGGTPVEDIVHSLGDPRIHLINLENNRGKGHALNIAFKKSSGAYIAYNDDDDVWLPDHLERLMLAARELPGIDLAYCDAAVIELRQQDNGQYAQQDYTLPYQRQVTLGELMEFNQINGISVLHKRELFTKAGGFDEHLRALIDFDMWRRLAALSYPYHISKITAEHYIREAGDTGQITSMAERSPLAYKKQRLRIMKKRLPLPEDSPYHAVQEELYRKSIFEFFAYACRELFKKNKRAASEAALRYAERHKVFSVEGLCSLALAYMDRKKYDVALEHFASYLEVYDGYYHARDLFFAYYCALETRSIATARKWALRIAEKKDSLGDEARELFREYNEKFLSYFGEPIS